MYGSKQINFFLYTYTRMPSSKNYKGNDPTYCQNCNNAGTCAGPCKKHPIQQMLKDNAEHMEGVHWGDKAYSADKRKRNSETNSQKSARLKEETKDQKNMLEKQKEKIIEDNLKANCLTIDGKPTLKHAFNTKCKMEEKVLPVTLADGSTFPGGCYAHTKGYCPFVHKGEENKHFSPEDRVGMRKVIVDAKYLPASAHGTTRKRSKSPPKKSILGSWRGGMRSIKKH